MFIVQEENEKRGEVGDRSATRWRGGEEKEWKRKGKEEEEEEEEDINPPFAADPDWTVENSQLEDKIFRPGVDPRVNLSEVERAVAVLEAEMDGEVERVIRSAGSPGKHGGCGAGTERRRGRLDRLSSKLETVRNKARSVSARSRI